MRLSTAFSKTERSYTGVELRPHFLLSELGLKGSALAAFIGPCEVATEHLVDWEDRLAADRIEARWMVHFLGEFFGSVSLSEAVWIQRLVMSILCDEVNEALRDLAPEGDATRRMLRCVRRGDDLFMVDSRAEAPGQDDRKLTVSIATASPVSKLLHIGVNIDPEGAPVPAIGLSELGILPQEWVPKVLERISQEWDDVEWACAKVRPMI